MPTSKKLPPLPLAQGCACSPPPSSQHSRQLVDSRGWNIRYFIAITLLAALWWGAYSYILPTAKWLSYKLLGFAPGSHLGASVEFFLYDSVKILLLLVAMIYAIGWVRASMNVDRVREYLLDKHRGIGYFLGSGFGAITPFC